VGLVVTAHTGAEVLAGWVGVLAEGLLEGVGVTDAPPGTLDH